MSMGNHSQPAEKAGKWGDVRPKVRGLRNDCHQKDQKKPKNNQFPTIWTWEVLGKQWEGVTVLGDAAQCRRAAKMD